MEINQRGLQHSLKIIVKILMILTVPDHKKSKGKASHPEQIKSLKKGKRKPRAGGNTKVPNDPPLDPDIQDEDILITD